MWKRGARRHLGVSAAIANAVYHATGRRIRSLPITLTHAQLGLGSRQPWRHLGQRLPALNRPLASS
jgi:hypothetical protein